MAYTVSKLGKISGVSVRTLHWYDELGLLKPAYHGSGGYRYYEEEQLLILQQILFFRELGLELKQIKRILSRGDFDKLVALSSHREVLKKSMARTKKLIKTIDKTMEHLKGKIKMKEQEMYYGFSKEKQAEYEKQIIDRFGKTAYDESRNNIKNWSKTDWARSKEEFDTICKELTALLEKKAKGNSEEVQKVIREHFNWLSQYWTPTNETYAAHGKFIEESELRKAYEKYHHELPKFISDAIQVFAKNELGS